MSLNGVALVAAVVAAVLVWVVPSYVVGRLAPGRGRRFWLWFVAAVIWSPIVVGVVVLILRDRSKPHAGEERTGSADGAEEPEAARRASRETG